MAHARRHQDTRAHEPRRGVLSGDERRDGIVLCVNKQDGILRRDVAEWLHKLLLRVVLPQRARVQRAQQAAVAGVLARALVDGFPALEVSGGAGGTCDHVAAGDAAEGERGVDFGRVGGEEAACLR